MSTVTSPSPPIESCPEPVPAHYLNVTFGVRSWLLTTDHKRIAWLYLFSITGIFFGGAAITLVRLHLVHDTYFVIAHFHFIMVDGAVMAYMAGLHFWWPKMTGRLYPEGWGRLSALIIFVGFVLTFVPQFVLGYLGMPRRYHHYVPEFQVLNVLSSAGASILGVGYLLPLVYLIWSLWYGKVAGANPWKATGLEWQTASPPPTDNFAVTPVVTVGPYEYASENIEVVG